MNRSQFNKVVVPGLFSFASEAYKPRSSQQMWRKIVSSVKPSKRAYEESAYYGTLGTVPKKPEGVGIAYDEPVQGPTKRWTHATYGLGARITEELIEDSLYPAIGRMQSLSEELGTSGRETLELLVHDVINSGTGTTTHTDGLAGAIFATGKTRLRGGTWDNLLSPAADLSATSLQTALQNFETQRDDSGKIQMIKPRLLLVAPANEWKARELLQSTYDPESPNNSVNTIRSRNLELMVSAYLTDTDAFTLIADPPHSDGGLIAYMRRAVTIARDSDFETGDAKIKITFRFSVEINKPNTMFHSAGA